MKRFWLILFALLAGCTDADDSGDTAADAAIESTTRDNNITAEGTTDDSEDRNGAALTFALAAEGLPGDAIGRVDLNQTGNRVIKGAGAIGDTEPTDIALPAIPVWIVPWKGNWVVVLETGEAVLMEPSGAASSIGPASVEQPPLVTDGIDGPVIGSVLDDPLLALFDDPLPDTRIVRSDDLAAALVQPTDRYPHGVFGDRIEAAAVQVINTNPTPEIVATFGPEAPSVIEAVSPMFADLTGDGAPEIIVTQSNADVGAWLAVWTPDGELVAESPPIGLGNRWRNQLGVAPVGPNGEIELMDVRTPHIGGTLQYFRLQDGALVKTADSSGFTSHQFGSRNIDLAVVADGDGDRSLDVIIPSDDLTELAVVTRTEAGVTTTLHDLGGRLTTNVAAATDRDGRLTIATGTNNQTLRVWAP